MDKLGIGNDYISCFYRQYREIHIRKECELLARMEIEKIKKGACKRNKS